MVVRTERGEITKCREWPRDAFSSGFLVGYGSTKGALTAFTKCLAVELAEKKFNCRVNVINPGFVKTSYYKNFTKNKKLLKWTIENTPMKRWAEPKEISNLA